MKYINSVFFIILLFLIFSCAGTADSVSQADIFSEPAQSGEITGEPEEVKTEPLAQEPQDFFAEEPPEPEITETESDEDQLALNMIDDDETEEFDEAEEFIDVDITAGLSEQNDDDAVSEQPPVEEAIVTEPVDTEPQTDLSPDPAQTVVMPEETQPQTTAQAPVQPPATQVPQSQAPAQPPAEQPPQSQAPAQPPAEQTPQSQAPARQPPVPPPALLGPAEERPSPERTVIPQSEPRWEPPAREPPFQTAVTPQNDDIVFSRTVHAAVGQTVEIPFLGTGWVYLGELASRRGIVYNSTRRDSEGQSIIFSVEAAGTYVLKFYKEDFLRGYILNDHVRVIAEESPAAGGEGWFNPPYDRGRVVAQPRWPSVLGPQSSQPQTGDGSTIDRADIQSGSLSGEEPPGRSSDTPPANISAGEPPFSQGVAPSQGTTASQGTLPSQETVPAVITEPAAGAAVERSAPEPPPIPKGEGSSPEEILQKAQEAFEEGNTASAIALLDQFREYYPSGSDELYWLYGQFYEANTPSRNILLSLDYYRRLVREYPQSSRVNDARRRIAYLERFYINIR